jgi:hypothetical protein
MLQGKGKEEPGVVQARKICPLGENSGPSGVLQAWPQLGLEAGVGGWGPGFQFCSLLGILCPLIS